jgi:hypothetical protein
MSGKAFEGEHLSLYRGSLRGHWREGSHTEDSKTIVIEGSTKQAFFLQGLHKGNRKVLTSECSANMFIGPEPVFNIFFCHV